MRSEICVYVALLAGVMVGCAPNLASRQLISVQSWDRTLRQADALRKIDAELGGAHHYAGQPAKNAVIGLEAVGFHCSVQNRHFFKLAERNLVPHIITESVPTLYCSKPHVPVEVDDLCRIAWAGFKIDWKNLYSASENFRSQLDTSLVTEEVYFCAAEPIK